MDPGRRPLIGVTGPDHGLPLAWWFTRWSIAWSGGDAVRLSAASPHPPAALDAIVIGGGTDIEPGLYGGKDDGKAPRDTRRDAFETHMIEAALEAGMPMLGICRGMQLINIVLGGDLHQDVRSMRRHTSNRRTPLPRKTALIEAGSALHAMLECSRCRINSLHHQAVDRIGTGLRVVARDLDGLAQAIEGGGERFLVGLQWHPEYLVYHSRQRAVFGRLVDAARDQAGATPGRP